MLERLLWRCLRPGAHGDEDGGLAAQLLPLPDETVLVFRTDCADFRFGLPADRLRVSDLLFFRRSAIRPGETDLLFVELKGGDYERGHEQLVNAMDVVLAPLEPAPAATPGWSECSSRTTPLRPTKKSGGDRCARNCGLG